MRHTATTYMKLPVTSMRGNMVVLTSVLGLFEVFIRVGRAFRTAGSCASEYSMACPTGGCHGSGATEKGGLHSMVVVYG